MAMRWPLFRRRAPEGIALALQGGGAHGAFTWGVLDALLERNELSIHAVSGTSAGAMNAVMLAQGLLEGGPKDGREGARAALARFWHAVGDHLPFEWLTQGDGADTQLTPVARWWLHWSRMVSPYQRLSLEPNPLRTLLEGQVDFPRLAGSEGPELYIAATEATNGRLRLFRRRELTIDAVLASACLPMLQPAVMIDGQPYWDGGYSANPAIFPLLDPRAGHGDLLIVMLSPWVLGPLPTTPAEIAQRATDIGFNAAFLREMHAIALARESAGRHLWPSNREARLRDMRWHVIDGHGTLAPLAPDSRLIVHRPFLEHLRDAGRARALDWLGRHGDAIGRASSADIGRLFGDHRTAVGE